MPGRMFRNAKLYKKSAVKSPRAKKVMSARRAKPTLVQRVQRIISQNVENKYTDTYTRILPVMILANSGTGPNFFEYFSWAPGSNAIGSQMFDLSQGVNQQQRVGNTIKLKRWVIKGLIQPSALTQVDPIVNILDNTNVGYIDVFFGRLLNNASAIENTLDDLYQAGAQAITPNATASTVLFPLNKDKYKIYWRKRFKMGAAIPDFTGPGNITNNDFSLTRTFGFDVTRFILKNKHIKYEDATTNPNDDMVENLTLFATFYPAIGNVSVAQTLGDGSYYTLNVQTYAEYEDA